MARNKFFSIRMDDDIAEQVYRTADEDYRKINLQLEYLIKRGLDARAEELRAVAAVRRGDTQLSSDMVENSR